MEFIFCITDKKSLRTLLIWILQFFVVSKQKQILLIDDDPSLHKLLQKFANLHEFVIHSAFDGKSGLELILKNKYDIILVDLMMPNYSGTELIWDLEKKRNISDMNIFLFSAADIKPHIIDDLKTRGVKEVIRKPLKLRDLLRTIKILDDV